VATGAGVHGDEEIDRRALEDAVVDAGRTEKVKKCITSR